MMRILLTNDDGYDAEGIQLLYELLQPYGEVFLVAPHTHMSGASISRQFWYESTVMKHSEHIYSVEGTPADAVHFGIFGLNLNPDLLISGINNGLNIGIDTIYSGTVGAAMEGLKAKLKTVAFSTDWDQFELARNAFPEVMNFLLEHDLPSKKYVLNVNFTTKKHPIPKGIVITDLAFRPMHHYYVETTPGKFRTKRQFLPYETIPFTDLWAAEEGYVSITPLKLGNHTQSGLDELKSKVAAK
jgi:5'-nucleotidase